MHVCASSASSVVSLIEAQMQVQYLLFAVRRGLQASALLQLWRGACVTCGPFPPALPILNRPAEPR